MTAVVDEIGDAFTAALAADAGLPATTAEPLMPAPPRKPEPDGQAPARPRRKPRPAKPAADEKPRTAPAAQVADPARDYTADLVEAGEQVWFGASFIQGGKLGPLRLPDLRPYAAVFRDQIPQQAQAWNAAAQQNASVRRYVSKLSSGDGGVSWVIGVGIATAGLVSACVAIASGPAEVREKLTAANDKAMEGYIKSILDRAGLEAAA